MAHKKTNEEFIERARLKHGDFYDYSKVKYTDRHSFVTILCPLHGEYEQRAKNHYIGSGCCGCMADLAKQSRKRNVREEKLRQDFSHITPPEGAKLIPLTQGKYALVDEEDYERVMEYNWNTSKMGLTTQYAVNSAKGKLHRFILRVTDPNVAVDHINHNGLDDRKCNLRICSHLENSFYTRPTTKTKSSLYKGVNYNKADKNWKSSISCNYNRYHLGYFKTEEEAARAYDKVAKELYGEFAYLNFKD